MALESRAVVSCLSFFSFRVLFWLSGRTARGNRWHDYLRVSCQAYYHCPESADMSLNPVSTIDEDTNRLQYSQWITAILSTLSPPTWAHVLSPLSQMAQVTVPALGGTSTNRVYCIY